MAMSQHRAWAHDVSDAVSAVFLGVDRDELTSALERCVDGDTTGVDVALDVRGDAHLLGGDGSYELRIEFSDPHDAAAGDPAVRALEVRISALRW
jgi:hypothetical protein